MPQVIPLVAYGAAVLGGASALGAAFIATLASVVVSSQQKNKAERAARDAYNASMRDQTITLKGGVNPRPIVYGKTAVGGQLIYAESTGSAKENLILVVALAHGEVDAIETVYFNDIELAIDGSDNVTTAPYYIAEPAPTPDTPAFTTGEVLRFGSVRALLIANGVLFCGVALQAAALGKQAYDITGRAADLGWIGLCEFLPAMLLVLVTGTRRRPLRPQEGGAVRHLRRGAHLHRADGLRAQRPHRGVAAVRHRVHVRHRPRVRRRRRRAPCRRWSRPRAGCPRSSRCTRPRGPPPPSSVRRHRASSTPSTRGSPTRRRSTLIATSMVFIGGLKFERQPDPPDPDEKPTFRSAIEGLLFIRRTPILFAAIALDLFAVLFGGAVALLPAIAEDQSRRGRHRLRLAPRRAGHRRGGDGGVPRRRARANATWGACCSSSSPCSVRPPSCSALTQQLRGRVRRAARRSPPPTW